jgi:hypothetical protein
LPDDIVSKGSPYLRTRSLTLPVYGRECGTFRELLDARILVYFPHGIGDWAQFAYLLALLEPSNRYWMTRYGDDFVALIDGCGFAGAAYTGVSSVDNDFGGAFGNRHFGIELHTLDGTPHRICLPERLSEFCRRERINALLWETFSETRGTVPYPFHSKARNALQHLISAKRLSSLHLDAPLTSALSFRVGPIVRAWVESRLDQLPAFNGRKICLIARNGYTSMEKNWGHAFRQDLPPQKRREGEECRDFMRLLRRKDDRWIFLVIEDRLFEGDDTMRSRELHAYSYAELFGTGTQTTIPFGLVMRVLASIADLCVGVPTGPFHVCMAKADLPTVGIWIQHLPSWYEEPKAASVHVIARNARNSLIRYPGSFCTKPGLEFRAIFTNTRIISGEQAIAAVEALL